MEEFKKLMKGKGYVDSSIKTIYTNIKSITGKKEIKKEYLEDIEDIEENLTKYKISTQHAILNSILVYLRLTDEKLLKKYEEIYEPIKISYNETLFYPEVTSKITWDKVIEYREKYKKMVEKDKEDKQTYFKYLLLSLYTYLPPLRGGEYINCICLSGLDDYEGEIKKREKNIYAMDKRKFYMGYTKTIRRTGIRIIDVPQELGDIICDYFERFHQDNSLLFCKEISSAGLTFCLNSIFGTKVSTSHLRKVYISSQVPKMDIKERKMLAKIMGHTPQVQEIIYNAMDKK